MLPAAFGQPQNWVGAGVAVSPDDAAPLTVALTIDAEFQPFFAAYKAPASTALLTCIAS